VHEFNFAVDDHRSLSTARSGPEAEERPWKIVEDVKFATLSWVDWHNNDRPHGCLDDISLAEFEETLYATKWAPADPGRN
jgi:transposase InsO family protein